MRIGSLDGVVGPAADIAVPGDDDGLRRGDGVFEVLRTYDGVAFALPEHIQRLARSAESMGIGYDEDALIIELENMCRQITADASIRVIVTSSGRRVITEEALPAHPDTYGLQLVAHTISPLMAGVKSLSYGANMAAHRLARRAGHDTALFFDPRGCRVTEAPRMSFAWCEAEHWYTPPLSDGILDGITRRVLLAVTGCEERGCTLDSLRTCDGAAVMSTTAEMRPVRGFSGLVERPLAVGEGVRETCALVGTAIADQTRSIAQLDRRT
jgi:4-amino-4-deoxychorismate lyase